ncbi:hypothetical protein T439DRAFT_327042 [Meredithblackwellia eburnea MCA 4105]
MLHILLSGNIRLRLASPWSQCSTQLPLVRRQPLPGLLDSSGGDCWPLEDRVCPAHFELRPIRHASDSTNLVRRGGSLRVQASLSTLVSGSWSSGITQYLVPGSDIITHPSIVWLHSTDFSQNLKAHRFFSNSSSSISPCPSASPEAGTATETSTATQTENEQPQPSNDPRSSEEGDQSSKSGYAPFHSFPLFFRSPFRPFLTPHLKDSPMKLSPPSLLVSEPRD